MSKEGSHPIWFNETPPPPTPPLRGVVNSTDQDSVADPNPDPDPHVLGLPNPDPLVRGMDPDPDLALDPDPDPSIIMQKQ